MFKVYHIVYLKSTFKVYWFTNSQLLIIKYKYCQKRIIDYDVYFFLQKQQKANETQKKSNENFYFAIYIFTQANKTTIGKLLIEVYKFDTMISGGN